jgi:addiction module HigA family antidote
MTSKSPTITEQPDGESDLLQLVTPGEVLLEEFLKPMGISQYRLAHDVGVPARRINEIVHGTRAITADTAMRLGRYFGVGAEFWMRLQYGYALRAAERLAGDRIEREVKVLPRAG